MKCSKCGAELPEGAKFCGSCGKKTGGLSRGKAIGIAVAGLVVIVAIASAGGEGGTGGNSAAPAQAAASVPALKVTAGELFDAYQANEAAAQQRYGGQPLEVSGTVDGVDLDFRDEPVVKLRTSNQFMSAQASLVEESQPQASSLAKGQTIVLTCAGVSEAVGVPMLKDCRL